MNELQKPQFEISSALAKLIERGNAKINKSYDLPSSTDHVKLNLSNLRYFGQVEVGRRAQCGKGKACITNPTYELWGKVVKRLAKEGVKIEVERVKGHANGSPTRAGGFWDSNIYRLSK